MSFLEILQKKRDTEESVKPEASVDPIQLAHNASDVINDGIMRGNLETANIKLDQLAADGQREVCVFYPQNNVFYRVSLIIVFPLAIIGIWTMAVAVQTAFLSEAFRTQAALILILTAIWFLWGAARIVKGVRDNQFLKRYKKYYQLIKYKRLILVDELADYAHVSNSMVFSDIKNAIRLKYIPQGYFNDDNTFLILSSDVYRDYLANRAAYNHYMKEKLEVYHRQTERPPEIQAYLDEGRNYIDRIHQDNSLIKDKEISEQLDRMENTVSVIFNEFDINPENADELAMLLQYYLPTTEKLLQTYIQLSSPTYSTLTAYKAQKEIAVSIENANRAYERILDQIFKQKEIDISSDIEAMSSMMKQEGLLDDADGERTMDSK